MEKILNVKTNLEALVEVLNNSLDDENDFEKDAIEFVKHESGIDIEPVDNYDDFVKRTTTDLKGVLNIEGNVTFVDSYFAIFNILNFRFPALPIESAYELMNIIMNSLGPSFFKKRSELKWKGSYEEYKEKRKLLEEVYNKGIENCLMSAMKNDQRKSILKNMLDEAKGGH